jgi:hypothetical protein
MKNIKTILLIIVTMLLLVYPIIMTGCDLFSTDTVTKTKTTTITNVETLIPFAWWGNFNDYPNSSSFIVPADKILVIEYVTAHSQGDSNSINTLILEAYTNSKIIRYIIPMTEMQYSGGRTFSGSLSVNIYADPESKVSFGSIKSVGITGRTDLSISGYLYVTTLYIAFS